MKKRFKFSVVMAIYNVEKYLEEAIISVVKQSIGFEENIQLILVNDGSPDNSEDICLKYKEMYPNNIEYIKKENGGVSSARNMGLNIAKGEIINFLDSDDYFSKNAFELVYKSFNKYPETDVVAINLVNFEASCGSWVNALYFQKSQLVDFFEEPNFMQCQVGASFIRSKAALKYRFSEDIKIHEDTHYIYRIFCDNPKCATVNDATYWHRIRYKNNSATQTIKHKSNIKDLSIKVFIDLINIYKDKYGYVPDFLQTLILLEYNYYCFKKIDECKFNSDELLQLRKWINTILQDIDVMCIKDHFVLTDFDKRVIYLLKDDINNIYKIFPSVNRSILVQFYYKLKKRNLLKKAY